MNSLAIKKDNAIAFGLEQKILATLDEKSKELAEYKELPDILDNYDNTEKLRRLAEKSRIDRTTLNRIGEHLLKCIRTAGALSALIERQSGGDKKSIGHDVQSILPPAATELGYSGPKQRQRWELMAALPDNLYDDHKQKVIGTEEKILTAAGLLAAAKKYQRGLEKVAACTPTTAKVVHAPWQEWLPSQPDCDLLITDPPYATDIDDIAKFANEWLPAALAKVKPTGRAYVCIGAYPIELHSYLSVPPPQHLTLNQVLVWTYRNTLGPSPKHDYKLNWQAILYYVGVDAPPLSCPKMTEQFSVQDLNAPDARHDDNPNLARWHAWQKPNELADRFIRHSTKEGDLVLDPFAGTGTFILAAANLGRVALGCDQNADMVAIARTRGCLE